MSRAQWEAESSKVRQVFDPATGRVRLVRGAGEIIEQIVSKAEQKRLRQLATTWDGQLGSGSLPNTQISVRPQLLSLTLRRAHSSSFFFFCARASLCCALAGRLMYGAPNER